MVYLEVDDQRAHMPTRSSGGETKHVSLPFQLMVEPHCRRHCHFGGAASPATQSHLAMSIGAKPTWLAWFKRCGVTKPQSTLRVLT